MHKRFEAAEPTWHVAMLAGLRRRLNPFLHDHSAAKRVETLKASMQAKVEHPFRVLKRQFGYALANLWMARRQLVGTAG